MNQPKKIDLAWMHYFADIACRKADRAEPIIRAYIDPKYRKPLPAPPRSE